MRKQIHLGTPPVDNDYYDENQFKRYTLSRLLLFVFGSNLRGIHGKGAALEASCNYGAIRGIGVGIQGSSYAIPTKDKNIRTLPLDKIEPYIKDFVSYTLVSKVGFFVTGVGTGLAGYKPKDIAPMFKGAKNCWFPKTWRKYIEEVKEEDNE